MVIGVVLCGGQSIRMGADKGLLKNEQVTWAEITLRKLEAVRLPVLLSVNEQQMPAYADVFDSNSLVQDDELLNIGGPLKGILSVHLQQPGNDLLVLGCDMTDMHADVLECLLDANAAQQAEAIAFRHEGYIEPLGAIYTAGGLKKIHTLYQKDMLTRFSLHQVLAVLTTRYLPMPPEWKNHFRNFNSPEDLSSN